MKKIKVLFNTYPMAFHTPGGGEIQLKKYKEFIQDEDIDIELFNQWNPNFLSNDIIHFFSSMSGSVHFFAFIKKIGLPLFVSPNLWITNETKSLYDYNEIRMGFNLADFIICNSNAECETLSQVFNLSRGKFLTVYNGIDDIFFDKISPLLFRNHFDIQDKFILNVANIEPRKNQLNLIKSMNRIKISYKLIMIGGVRDEEYLKKCLELGGSNVIYLGMINHESELLRSAYSACEAFVLPSTVETPGLAALEAAVSGAKILVTEEGSTYEYFGDDAIYVNPNSIESIASGLIKVIEQTKSNKLELYLVKNFSWTNVVKQLEKYYHQVYALNQLRKYSNSFYELDSNSQGNIDIWTKEEIEFEIENCHLNFLWHTVAGANIDIYINNIKIYADINVGQNWESFSMNIFNDAKNNNKIKIIVKTMNKSENTLGVAFRDVTIIPMEQLGVLGTILSKQIVSDNQSSGFNSVEIDSSGCYSVWTKEEIEFEIENCHLNFLWHTVAGANIDIYINNIKIYADINVGQNWESFSMNIFNDTKNNNVKILVKNFIRYPEIQDTRILGIQLKDII